MLFAAQYDVILAVHPRDGTATIVLVEEHGPRVLEVGFPLLAMASGEELTSISMPRERPLDSIYTCVLSSNLRLIQLKLRINESSSVLLMPADTRELPLLHIEKVQTIGSVVAAATRESLILCDETLGRIDTVSHPSQHCITLNLRRFTDGRIVGVWCGDGNRLVCTVQRPSEPRMKKVEYDLSLSMSQCVVNTTILEDTSSDQFRIAVCLSTRRVMMYTVQEEVLGCVRIVPLKQLELEAGDASPESCMAVISDSRSTTFIGTSIQALCSADADEVLACGKVAHVLEMPALAVACSTGISSVSSHPLYKHQDVFSCVDGLWYAFIPAIADDILLYESSAVMDTLGQAAMTTPTAIAIPDLIPSAPEPVTQEGKVVDNPVVSFAGDAHEEEAAVRASWLVELVPLGCFAEDSVLNNLPAVSLAGAANGPTSRQTAIKSKGPKATGAVTFHAKIKSSSYGLSAPRKPAFAKSRAPSKSASVPKVVADVELFCRVPLFEEAGGTVKATDLEVSHRALSCKGILSLLPSFDGKHIALASSDGAICTGRTVPTAERNLRIPPGSVLQYKSSSAPNRSLAWSHKTYEGFVAQLAPPSSKLSTAAQVASVQGSRLLLSCGEDRFCRVFATGCADPVMTIDDAVWKTEAAVTGTSKTAFKSSCLSAHFFYHDKLINVASGNTVSCYAYAIDNSADEEKDDVVRLRKKAARAYSYKRATWWQAAPEGNSVTSICGLNAQRSSVVCAIGSDKAARIFDLGKGPDVCQVLALTDIHEKSIHTACFPTAYPDWAVTAASLNALLTASTDGAVKLWDLRSGTCAITLRGDHVNRVHACGISFHPNLAQIAVGSEDRTAVVYDLRTSAAVAKCKGATDVVTAVAFHPNAPALICGSLDGGLRGYRMDYSARLDGDETAGL